MNARRILVANELTSYRETIAVVIRDLHPNVEVFEAEPVTLDRDVARLRPDLVICSRVTSLVRDMVPNWVELYPDREPFSTLCIGGERTAMEDIQLSDLLSLCASPL
jgi:hypothetical protein